MFDWQLWKEWNFGSSVEEEVGIVKYSEKNTSHVSLIAFGISIYNQNQILLPSSVFSY